VPEGDTIHRAANTLRPALLGGVLERFWAKKLRGTRPRDGETVEDVSAMGKHLLIRFSGGLTLETHMKMSGSWHLYRDGDGWRQPEHLARVVLQVSEAQGGAEVGSGRSQVWQAVCFSAPDIRTFASGTSDPTPVSGLGPDLCDVDIDLPAVLAEVMQRWNDLAEPTAELGEVLLDQRIASGIGNVYKSEACHAAAVSPYLLAADVPEEKRRIVMAYASRQLRSNLTTSARTTVAGGLAVYGRNRQPCRVCGTPIHLGHQGRDRRVTYHCPTCQAS
jgi:endonuclease-8